MGRPAWLEWGGDGVPYRVRTVPREVDRVIIGSEPTSTLSALGVHRAFAHNPLAFPRPLHRKPPMVQIKIRYEGGLRCKATHGPSGQTLLTDAPTDNQGKGESFSPTDLLATAVGTCMLTIMGIEAERHGWDLVGSEVVVVKKMVVDPQRRVGELDIVVRVPTDLDGDARALLEKAAGACPVHASLSAKMSLPVRFEWGVAV